jgi:outer membrane protein TolC
VAVNNIRAALTNLTEQQETSQNALAILLGQAPQTFAGPTADLSSLKVPEVDLTPPAEVVTVRPDIQSAEAGLLAANADIGAARAAFFPSLKLGTDTTLAAAGFGHPATAAFPLASNVLAPIFSGGRLHGNLENVTARQKELAAQYQKTVLTAFREVEDALAALKSSRSTNGAFPRIGRGAERLCHRQGAFRRGSYRLPDPAWNPAQPLPGRRRPDRCRRGASRSLRSIAQSAGIVDSELPGHFLVLIASL